MATFQCLQSKNFVTFNQPYDIKTMMAHPEYRLVEEKPAEAQPEPVKRQMGRPRKMIPNALN